MNNVITENLDEEIKNIENTVNFKLTNFEGPLDILLHLIKDSKMSIFEVKIADITEQYLKVVQGMELDFNMEKTTDFLAMATVLLEIKSKQMLPQEAEDVVDMEDDPEERLRMQLLEYQLFKEASENLRPLESVDRLYKDQSKSLTNAKIVFKNFSYDNLLNAFALLLTKINDKATLPEAKKIKRDRWTVAEKIEFLRSIFAENDSIHFSELFDDLYSKLEIITVFMAILELIKYQEIEVSQNQMYEDITINKKRIENGI